MRQQLLNKSSLVDQSQLIANVLSVDDDKNPNRSNTTEYSINQAADRIKKKTQ